MPNWSNWLADIARTGIEWQPDRRPLTSTWTGRPATAGQTPSQKVREQIVKQATATRSPFDEIQQPAGPGMRASYPWGSPDTGGMGASDPFSQPDTPTYAPQLPRTAPNTFQLNPMAQGMIGAYNAFPAMMQGAMGQIGAINAGNASRATVSRLLDALIGGGAQTPAGFQFRRPTGEVFGGVGPEGYQTGIKRRRAWGRGARGAASRRLLAPSAPMAGISGAHRQQLDEGLLGEGSAALTALDREGTSTDRLLQYATEAAQGRAGIGGMELAGGIDALGRRQRNAVLQMLSMLG
ncbi:MAG TPA: hypothetical protein VM389_13070 [Phycisphaerae bacterium]|nr:hypothetical protein [Phycisphaerae bacterium]HUX15758.1 hypothetical protein [Phycisphaerae bacterium]